ncbi:MAG TPA: glycosyltransferase family 87 protein [Gemmataceae bacterium]|nr:glycosyltransferase family 87 protein [Gemmataceae bacterium]
MNRIARLLEGRARFGLLAGALMWVVWVVGSVLGSGNLDLNGQVIGTDHSAFHTAAVLLAEGRGDVLFQYPELTEFQTRQEELVGKIGFLDPYRNPPFYALLYLPTARLPYLGSYGVWAIIGVFGLIGGLALVRGREIRQPLAWSLSFYPVFAAVSFGQNTLLSFAAFGLVYRCLASERRFLAGLSAGLLLYKPQLLFGLGVWWLLAARRTWPCLLGLATAGAILLGMSAAFVLAETEEWVRRMPEIVRYDAFDFFNLHNLRGFGALLFANKPAGTWFGFAGLAVTIWWLWRVQQRHGANIQIMFAAAVFATLWGSPHTMTYEWALAVLPAVILWDARPDLRTLWTPLFAIAWVVLFVSTPLTKAQLSLTGVAIQLSVPVLAWVGWRAELALRRSG